MSKMRIIYCRLGIGALLATSFIFLLVSSTAAHAILLEAHPAPNSAVEGPDIKVRLRFNSRIDGSRSQLSLLMPDKSVRFLTVEKQETPEILASEARELADGSYRLRWQVLSADGHITRGEVPFQVESAR